MKALLTVSAATLLLICPAFAFALEAEIAPVSHRVRQGEFVIFDLKIHNDMPDEKSFLISIDGPHLEWKMPGDFLVVLQGGRTKTTKIIFRAVMEGKYAYTATVSCFTQPELYVEREFSMDVVGDGISLRGLDTDVDEGRLLVILDAVAWQEASGLVRMEIIGPDGMVYASSERPVYITGEKMIEEWLSLKGLMAGEYTLRVFAGDEKLEKVFVMEPVSKVTSYSTRLPGTFSDEVIIVVENEGNVVEDYILKEDISAGVLTGFVTKPQRCINHETGKECEFAITGLMPGEKRKVVYTIEHWPTYAQYGAGLLVLALLGVFTAIEMGKPRIKKKVIKRQKGHHTVMLEIKNPMKGISNVIVRDFVSPLAEVHSTFEQLRPIVKRSEAGTELIWKVGGMKPREVRILSYRIRPLVGGQLKMPKAYLRYRGNNGERIRVFSKHLHLMV